MITARDSKAMERGLATVASVSGLYWIFGLRSHTSIVSLFSNKLSSTNWCTDGANLWRVILNSDFASVRVTDSSNVVIVQELCLLT
jgi:hypothetical protein